jgi:hypothetical protein
MNQQVVAELVGLLNLHSEGETVDGKPWSVGAALQAKRITMLANWAAQQAAGDFCHITCNITNVTRGLAAAAYYNKRKLFILVPDREDQPTEHRTCKNPDRDLDSELANLVPFVDSIAVYRRRGEWRRPDQLAFSFVCSPEDYSTICADILFVRNSWLVSVEGTGWEQNAMRAIMSSRYMLKMGVVHHWKNREGYLMQQGS